MTKTPAWPKPSGGVEGMSNFESVIVWELVFGVWTVLMACTLPFVVYKFGLNAKMWGVLIGAFSVCVGLAVNFIWRLNFAMVRH